MSGQTRYLVTGGAGFLGISLIRDLLTAGVAVRSLDIAPFSYPEKDRIEVLDGDIRDGAAVERAMAGVDVVIHCAAALPLAPVEDILSTAIDGTRLLLEAARCNGVRRFVFISSTAVYGIPDHHPIVETDRLSGVGPYGESKIQAEALCATARGAGLCVSVLRPKSFVGPERLGAFELLYDWAYDGRNFPVLGSGNNLYQLLDVADLCRAIILCVDGPADAVNEVFNVGARSFGTMREDFQAVLDHAGHGGVVIGLPRAPAIALLRLFEAMHISPLYRWIYESAAAESYVDVTRASTGLGFAPRFSNREALIRNYDWYVAHRSEFRHLTGVTHRVPWKKGVLNVAKHFF